MLLGEELRARRVELNISQGELAGRLQVSQQTISRWESGGSSPAPRRIVELAEALRLNPSGLLRTAGYPVAPDLVADAIGPSIAELERLTTTELVLLIDAGWQELRSRLIGSPSSLAPRD